MGIAVGCHELLEVDARLLNQGQTLGGRREQRLRIWAAYQTPNLLFAVFNLRRPQVLLRARVPLTNYFGGRSQTLLPEF